MSKDVKPDKAAKDATKAQLEISKVQMKKEKKASK